LWDLFVSCCVIWESFILVSDEPEAGHSRGRTSPPRTHWRNRSLAQWRFLWCQGWTSLGSGTWGLSTSDSDAIVDALVLNSKTWNLIRLTRKLVPSVFPVASEGRTFCLLRHALESCKAVRERSEQLTSSRPDTQGVWILHHELCLSLSGANDSPFTTPRV